MKYPKASVVVLNYNGRDYLEECFQSLKEIDYPDYELIMADNASTDDSIEYAKKNFPWVRVLPLDKNYGFAEGNNRGAEVADGEVIAFLNNDTKVDRKWLTELVKPVIEDKNIGMCASKVLFYHMPDTIQYASGMISAIGSGIDGEGLGDKDGDKYNIPRYVGIPLGASMLITKDVFQEIGGFDGDYFAAHEETDLAWRCWLYGYFVLYVPSSIVYHKSHGAWSKEYYPSKVYYGQMNQLRNLVKNFGFKNLIKGLVVSAGFDLYRIIRYGRRGQFANIRAIWRANFDLIKEFNKLLKKRHYVQSNRRRSDKELANLGVFKTVSGAIKIALARDVWV